MRFSVMLCLIMLNGMGFCHGGIDELAQSMGQSFSSSIHALLTNLRTPFYVGELMFLIMYIKNNPKLALGGAGFAAMIYEFAVTTANVMG